MASNTTWVYYPFINEAARLRQKLYDAQRNADVWKDRLDKHRADTPKRALVWQAVDEVHGIWFNLVDDLLKQGHDFNSVYSADDLGSNLKQQLKRRILPELSQAARMFLCINIDDDERELETAYANCLEAVQQAEHAMSRCQTQSEYEFNRTLLKKRLLDLVPFIDDTKPMALRTSHGAQASVRYFLKPFTFSPDKNPWRYQLVSSGLPRLKTCPMQVTIKPHREEFNIKNACSPYEILAGGYGNPRNREHVHPHAYTGDNYCLGTATPTFSGMLRAGQLVEAAAYFSTYMQSCNHDDGIGRTWPKWIYGELLETNNVDFTLHHHQRPLQKLHHFFDVNHVSFDMEKYTKLSWKAWHSFDSTGGISFSFADFGKTIRAMLFGVFNEINYDLDTIFRQNYDSDTLRAFPAFQVLRPLQQRIEELVTVSSENRFDWMLPVAFLSWGFVQGSDDVWRPFPVCFDVDTDDLWLHTERERLDADLSTAFTQFEEVCKRLRGRPDWAHLRAPADFYKAFIRGLKMLNSVFTNGISLPHIFTALWTWGANPVNESCLPLLQTCYPKWNAAWIEDTIKFIDEKAVDASDPAWYAHPYDTDLDRIFDDVCEEADRLFSAAHYPLHLQVIEDGYSSPEEPETLDLPRAPIVRDLGQIESIDDVSRFTTREVA